MKLMYVVNLALKREDEKVEQDTFFTEIKPTQEQADEIAEKYNCDVILSCVGRFKPYTSDFGNYYATGKKAGKKEAENEKAILV